jgi:hypothetical protein
LIALKHFIEAKTKHLNDIILVQGKLEMLKNCQQSQGTTQKYWKIKSNIKKMKEESGDNNDDMEEDQVLVYQDFSDDEGKLD